MAKRGVYIYKRRDYMFCGYHIKKYAIISLISSLITVGIWYILRIIQLIDQDILFHRNNSSSVPNFVELIIPPFGRREYLVLDALIIICDGSSLFAIIKEKSCLVQPERYLAAIATVIASLASFFLFVLAGFFSRNDTIWEEIEKHAKRPDAPFNIFTLGPYVFLALAVLFGILAAACYFSFRMASRFREYLQDVENGIANIEEIPVFHA